MSSKNYCFRVVTEDGDEIEYTNYAKIDTTDVVNPVITSYSPDDDFLFPIGNFEISYAFNDADSGIDTTSHVASLQKWDGTSWG